MDFSEEADMDLSAIIVVVVLTALSLGTIVGLEIYSRKTQPTEPPADQAGSGAKAAEKNAVKRDVKHINGAGVAK